MKLFPLSFELADNLVKNETSQDAEQDGSGASDPDRAESVAAAGFGEVGDDDGENERNL